MQYTFTILTESGHRYHRIRRGVLKIAGKLLGRKIYGPVSVCNSLIRGIEELKHYGEAIEYNINPLSSKINEVVIVLIGKDTLHYALDLKKHGIVKKIYAGPAISVPTHNTDLFFHTNIDTILVPSRWVQEYFTSLLPSHPERIHIRPAGVADTGISKKSTAQFVIYKKNCPESLYQNVISRLEKQGIAYTLLEYGSFSFEEFQTLLDNATAMIYLQESESQGIALQEAWIKDIPTLVRDRGYRSYAGETRRTAKQISCPFLTATCGITFEENNFNTQLNLFISNRDIYKPREYCLEKLTDNHSTQLLLDIIQQGNML